jgi:hypothetical protein
MKLCVAATIKKNNASIEVGVFNIAHFKTAMSVLPPVVSVLLGYRAVGALGRHKDALI